MKSEQLHQVREACKQQLLDTLMTLARENGDDYNDYYRDEHGIDEDEGYTIVKVFDIAHFGCHVGLPLKWRDDIEGDTDPTPEVLADEFGYHAYWSLYIERDQTGYETLMLYQFCNDGVNWQSGPAEPDHSPASEMSLAELDYLTQAIYWHLRRDVEKEKEEDLWERITALVETSNKELTRLEVGTQIHVERHLDCEGYEVYVIYDNEDIDIKDTELELSDVPEVVERVFKELLDCYYDGYEDEFGLHVNEIEGKVS